MNNESYKKDWELCGDSDPYYGVLSDRRFLDRNLTVESREEFFRSGADHVNRVLASIKNHIDKDFDPDRILDFGCGVGRLIIPFAELANQVTGIDISEGMLTEARANCSLHGVTNVFFEKSLQQVDGLFDLVHSYIVFQHIPPATGILLLEALLTRVAISGVIAIHLTYSNQGSSIRKRIAGLRGKVGLIHSTLNILQGKSFKEPLLQMNEYSLSEVTAILQKNDFRDLHVYLTRHAKSFGVMLIGKKSDSSYEF